MNQTKKSDPFFDIDTYINNLERTIEKQKDQIESLKNEIVALKEEIEQLTDL